MKPRRIDLPEKGFYKLRLIRRGLWVPVMLWRWRGVWYAVVDGRTHRVDGVRLDPYEVWPFVQRVSHWEYAFQKKRARWAREHAPEHPAATPNQAIDRRKLKPLIAP